MSEVDDDDFQNPSEAFSFAQSRILSSLNDSCWRALKPGDASRPGKRPRKAAAAAAEGKENRENPQGLQVGAPFFSMTKDEERLKVGKRDGSSVGSSFISSSDYCIPPVVSRTVMQFDCRNELQNEKYSLFQSADSKAEDGKDGYGGFINFKAAYSSRSIESRLLALKEKSVANISVGGHLVEDDCEVLEVGTQLNELINLCCGMDEGASSHGGAFERNEVFCETTGSEQFTSVECPLCGGDITDLSNEQREIHTNDCLDKAGTLEVACHTDEAKSSSPDVVDTRPVIQWLQSLGLSKYKDIIVKEEIDWETLQSLTEEDLLKIGIDALGPRKKIIHALNELRQNKLVQYMDKNTSAASNERIKLQVPGNKLITEYFNGSSVDGQRVNMTSNPLSESSSKAPIPKRVSSTATRRAKFRDPPQWCCIAGTPFRVDAFRYLRGDCSHWFLTHFHMDHYQGLTKNFCHGKIYCSSITANLVNMKIGVSWDSLHILPLNQNITIAGVSLTCFDANHCPGAIIILFEPPNGKVVLHTGDFRFSEEMANNALLQSCRIHTLILDTTYCNPQYDFPKQEAVTQFVIEAIQAEAFNPKTLFLIGSYTIGKERLYLEVARILKKKVYIGAAKLRLLRHLELPEEDMKWLTANEMESHVHVVPMWTLASFKRMKYVASQYSARYDLIVAISPTGWAYGKGKKNDSWEKVAAGDYYQEAEYMWSSLNSGLRNMNIFGAISPPWVSVVDNCIGVCHMKFWSQFSTDMKCFVGFLISLVQKDYCAGEISHDLLPFIRLGADHEERLAYEVPYSEHSSFTELKEFVRFISPQQIIPSVNNDGPQSADAMISLLTSD